MITSAGPLCPPRPRGGLLIKPRSTELIVSSAPEITTPVSWLGRCQVGDDQGNEGACAIFAMASWFEITHPDRPLAPVSNETCFRIYKSALARAGRPAGSGLYFQEALDAFVIEGYLPPTARLVPARLYDLRTQPLIAGYVMTRAFDNVSRHGCLDHADPLADERGYHAIVVVATGPYSDDVYPDWVWIENSWGLSWGWNGIGMMRLPLHQSLCKELYRVEVP